MGAIRGLLLVFVSVLLFLTFILGNLALTLSISLNYNNLEKQATTVLKDVIQEKMNVQALVESYYPVIQTYCQTSSEYVFNSGGFTITIPCSIASQGTDAILDKAIKDAMHDIYYKDYGCDFIDCFQKSEIPLFLISEKSYNYIHSKLLLLLLVAVVLLAAMFLLVQKKSNAFILAGSLLIISSLLFFKLDVFFSFISDKTILKILGIISSNAFFIAIRVLIAGIVLILAGIIMKIFKIGFFISNLLSKLRGKKEAKPKAKPKVQKKGKSQQRKKKSK